jgi:UDP-GlcNAc:undecaprenyl-phosphate/decaprenyl-phosphate GlcNAc-1-phosphate transferase
VDAYLCAAFVACAATAVTVPSIRAIAMALDAVARVRDRDVHTAPIPYLGGVAIYAGLWAGYLTAHSVPGLGTSDQGGLSDVRDVLLVCGVICAFGIADDLWELNVLVKSGAQLVVGGLLALMHVQLWTVPLPGGSQLALDPNLSALLTVILVVVGANAINLIDGLDGLAAGVVAGSATGLFVFAYFGLGDLRGAFGNGAALLPVLILGACAGFYYHNAYPARIFMGDAGSMLLGTALVAATVLSLQLMPIFAASNGVALGLKSRVGVFVWIALPIAICGVPIFDLTLAVCRRLKNRASLFLPDKRHLHHVLVLGGHSHRSASLFLTAWSFTVAVGSAWIVVAPSLVRLISVGVLATALLAIGERVRTRPGIHRRGIT